MQFPHHIYESLSQPNDSKLVLLVADGLGGLPLDSGGMTELETAQTPNLDQLVSENTCGAMFPVGRGITPGSGPAHLGLFGLDPLKFAVGRGVLEALGADLELNHGDIAIRGNFCTVGEDGLIIDRRAGRMTSQEGSRLVEKLKSIQMDAVEILVKHVEGYRFAVVLRGENLDGSVADTDPGLTGVPPNRAVATASAAARTAMLINTFVDAARERLTNRRQGNMVLLRGIDSLPKVPTMHHLYKMRSCAAAVYPMYRGVAKLVGMHVPLCGSSLSDQITAVEDHWSDYDFFFVHFKRTDTNGEDGDFSAKVRSIEELDSVIPRLTLLAPDVLVVTGDHSTPSKLCSHSWHPVPVLLAAKTSLPDCAKAFGERACLTGGLGQFEAKYLLGQMLAHAGRLTKFGA